MEVNVPSLWDALAKVSDNRRGQGKRYSLQSLLALAVLATLCGYKSYAAMVEWAKNYPHIAERIGLKRPPAVGTLFRVFGALDLSSFGEVVDAWARSILEQFPGESLSLDGKVLRGNHARGVAETWLISAVSHKLGLTVSQVAFTSKKGEIVAGRELLEQLAFGGRVVTLDALHTTPETARRIVEKGGTTC